MADKKYLSWQEAGGPNECAHGYAEGIPCPRCDEIRAAHRDRMEALKLDPKFTCYNRDELIRLYNQNVERAYDYGIESITGVPAAK